MAETTVAKRAWERPTVHRIGASAAENGALIGPEALILRS